VCDTRAIDVPIGAPGAVARDVHGDVYFTVPNQIFKVDAGGGITHVAGNITAGFAGDGGPATQALLNFPTWYPERVQDPYDFVELLGALALDAEGNLYITDAYNNRVRKVDANGIITTIAGDGERGWTSDGVQAANAHFWWPQGVAMDAAGNLLIADGNGELHRVLPDGSTFRMANNDCGDFLNPGLCAPEGIAVDAAGGVYVADIYCRIRKFGGAGNDGTVAGDEHPDGSGSAYTCGYSGDGGPATSAALAFPFGVAVDALGNLYIADTYNNCIRKVDIAGVITTHAGTCSLRTHSGTLIRDGSGFSGDGGPATAAQLRVPHGVAVDAAGNVYIADTGNLRLRKVSPEGIITTIAGNGHALALQ
jgi:sugar lactone lactonase YvrE